MKLIPILITLAAFIVLPLTSIRAEEGHDHAEGLIAEYPFAYATSAKQKNGAAYFTLRNMARVADTLTGASSPVAEKTELHTTTITPNEEMQMDVASMKKLDMLYVPEMSTLYFDPIGRHVMLMGLKKQLVTGETFPLTLEFKNADPVTVDVLIVDNNYEVDVEGGEHWLPQEAEHEHDHEEHGHDESHDDHDHGGHDEHEHHH
ncbi:MAG: copper chaperone PCu(A)C [Alphaproteobacteria bacterium]|nr:copper chaperone PCu(A)C [Alphaproteobacteria bacterium]MCD8520090.1 copper chaperone PCu(A)C [Alphaproteobacteria bacterium]MCD8525868.1 copper chaperone PCu(A)C [Alphaproteobacteria bacterium]MCD8570727.1 copper chaperone PCu(A)C [Alphaproteobacteria bacterium]